MSDQERIIRFFECMSRQDLDGLERELDPDATFLFPKTQALVGREKILKFLRLLFRKYPELRFQVQDILIEGARAAAHWTNRGRKRSGEDYSNEGVTWMEWREGRLLFISDFFKDTELF